MRDFLNRLKSKYLFSVAALIIVTALSLYNLNLSRQRWIDREIIVWDSEAYYQYLRGAFIYRDITLQGIDTLRESERHDNGLMRVAGRPDRPAKMSMGMSVSYIPAFLLAKWKRNNPGDSGFEPEYQHYLLLMGWLYMCLGLGLLVALGRALRISDIPLALMILAMGIGTNLFYYGSTEAVMSHAYLFCLQSAILLCTCLWHRTGRFYQLAIMAACLALGSLARPTFALSALIPLLWNMGTPAARALKWRMIKKHALQIIPAAAIALLIVMPQFLYWKKVSGQWLLYSYVDERFYFDRPRFYLSLFSWRKGWLVYSPLFLLLVPAFVVILRKRKELFPLFAGFTLVFMWVTFSWWNWWYGGSFGHRAMIDGYAVFGLMLALLFQAVYMLRHYLRRIVAGGALICFIAACIGLNLFQSYQYRKGMWHWEEMSKELYMSTFLRDAHLPEAEYKSKLDPLDKDAAMKGEVIHLRDSARR